MYILQLSQLLLNGAAILDIQSILIFELKFYELKRFNNFKLSGHFTW